MRTYKVNDKGEKMYQLECTNFDCKNSPDSVIIVAWRKEYEHDLKCEKCGRILRETMANWEPMPKLDKNISTYEFYREHFLINGRPVPFSKITKAYFAMMEDAMRKGSMICLAKGRPKDWDGYLISLAQTAQALLQGKTINLFSQNPDEFIGHLKHYYNIEVTIEKKEMTIRLTLKK